MTDTSNRSHAGERLIAAYEKMLERSKAAIERAEDDLPNLYSRIEDAREKAVELGELTREEAERISDYLKRDLQDAAQFMTDSGKELREWLQFDLKMMEDRMFNLFNDMVDHTRLELDRLAARARAAKFRHTGEVTAPGVLRCEGCGKEIHLKKTGHIPPCPKCHGTEFTRVAP